ncbi:ATP-binding cassette domain-containing protein [candidate division KSB3 bacterium]|uniref:ATP-binding cassette domain-containing protein n=1 Tax=candidate division KSB3 bacterium TaxID=2044937 RepID=A0A9D5JS61_9BACT|nr:ATP-binding cassette domain-containing protein [candidate division KSB3 bacterium]MBD3323255.1 ATP-binding cassette domain-containing protein [candidate division KSB3 bacterium]
MELMCQHLAKVFPSSQGDVSVLKDVDFAVAPREFVSIVGPSGCGKTTLLKLIAGLVQPTSGRITFGAANNHGRPQQAMVFQEHGLLPWMTILDNVALGLERHRMTRTERREPASRFLAQVGLSQFANHYPSQLSVGMRQRAAISRAFIAEPHILLMDEPFSALDAQTRLIMQEELLRIWQMHHQTIVYVTHDIEEAILLSDRVLVMSGRPATIIEEIPVFLERPRRFFDQEYPVVKELTRHIWHLLETDARQYLLRGT